MSCVPRGVPRERSTSAGLKIAAEPVSLLPVTSLRGGRGLGVGTARACAPPPRVPCHARPHSCFQGGRGSTVASTPMDTWGCVCDPDTACSGPRAPCWKFTCLTDGCTRPRGVRATLGSQVGPGPPPSHSLSLLPPSTLLGARLARGSSLCPAWDPSAGRCGVMRPDWMRAALQDRRRAAAACERRGSHSHPVHLWVARGTSSRALMVRGW